MPDLSTDLYSRMGALLDGASYDWSAGPDAMRWRPDSAPATATVRFPDIDTRAALARLAELRAAGVDAPVGLSEFVAEFAVRLGESFRAMTQQLAAALRESWQCLAGALSRAAKTLQPLMRILRPRSAPRAAWRAEPVTRAAKLARRSRRADLRRYVRESRRG